MDKGDSMRELILDTISDLVKDFIYYDRKEDEDLPVGSIEDVIRAGQITINEMVGQFRSVLIEELT
jgi:hypothetical protein